MSRDNSACSASAAYIARGLGHWSVRAKKNRVEIGDVERLATMAEHEAHEKTRLRSAANMAKTIAVQVPFNNPNSTSSNPNILGVVDVPLNAPPPAPKPAPVKLRK